MSETTLRDTIEAHARENGLSLEALTAMSPHTDPYRIDTPANRRDAEWLAQSWETCGARRPIHLRGLHYALVSTPDLAPRPDGLPYINTKECWDWLGLVASKARWLGLIPFEHIVDERNSAPLIYTQVESEESAQLSVKGFGAALWIPDTIRTLLPEITVVARPVRQAYRLVFIGEKQSLEDVLLPIATRYHAELVLPSGELSKTLLHGIAQRAAVDGRPCRIFYFADFDPAGFQMPVGVSRKLQALVERSFPNLDAQLRRCALTAEQVEALGLPSTPLKETERRADRWRERFGVEQTEIDALATLRPHELQRIVLDAIRPYWDDSLQSRTITAAAAARQEAEEALEAVLEGQQDRIAEAEAVLAEAHAAVEHAAAEIGPLLSEIEEAVAAAVDEIEIDEPEPEPEPEGDVDEALFCTGRDWVRQTEILREAKL